MSTSCRLSELPNLVGRNLGESAPIVIEQERIDRFARATGDLQWIHVDPVRAASGPFGATVAHGYLTLALLIPVWEQLLDVEDATVKVNYGLDKVRFPSPAVVGSELRGTATIAAVDPVPGGTQLHVDLTLTPSSAARPVCVARAQFRYLQ